MKKLNVTKEHFEKSNYFNKKYGKLEYVSESGKLFKTEKGKILMFKESFNMDDYNDRPEEDRPKYDIGEYVELTDDFFFNCDDNTMSDMADTGWMVEDVREGDEDGEWEYYIVHDNPYGREERNDDDDYSIGYWVEDYEIKKERGKKSSKNPKFLKESCDEEFDRYYERMKKIFRYDSGIHIRLRDNEDGSETIEVTFDDRFNWNDDVVSGRIPLDEDSGLLDWITRFDERAHRNGWEFDFDIAKDIEHPIDGGANNDYLAMLTLTCKCDKKEDDLLFESSDEKLDNPEALIKFIRGLPDGDEYLFQDGGKWIATNEWLCGTFAGQGFEGDTEEEAVQKLIDYLNLHIGHKSMVGQNVTKSGWPIASKVAEYVGPEEEEVDESAMPLKGDQETGTMAKVNDLVSKAYASLYDELKKAGIDFDAASDDGFYVNDSDAQKTYFINLYVNECQEYEGSYRADESKKKQ